MTDALQGNVAQCRSEQSHADCFTRSRRRRRFGYPNAFADGCGSNEELPRQSQLFSE
jgi:hypothetical protein